MSSGCWRRRTLLNNGLPDNVELVGFCQDGWDVEMATDVLKKFVVTMLLKIATIEVAQVEFDVAVNQVIDTKNGTRDVADVEAVVHVDVASNDADVFIVMHLDVVAICS